MNVHALLIAVLIRVYQVLSQEEEDCGRKGQVVRVLNGPNHFGRVELRWGDEENGCEWSPVCGATWNHNKAGRTCRQLQFTYDKHQDHEAVWFSGSGASCVDLDCTDSASSNLQDCKITESNQTEAAMVAGVLCDVPSNLPTMRTKSETSQFLVVGIAAGVAITIGIAIIVLLSVILKGVYHYKEIQLKRFSEESTICTADRVREISLPSVHTLEHNLDTSDVVTDRTSEHVHYPTTQLGHTTITQEAWNYDHLLNATNRDNEEAQNIHEYAILADEHTQ